MEDIIYMGQIMPKGWLINQLERSLDGYVGHLNQLVPELVVDHDIYGEDRIDEQSEVSPLGRNDVEIEEINNNEEQFFWWNSETQSNWKDGFYRSAILYNAEPFLSRAKEYVEKMIEKQDEDGYMGIYTKALRYRHTTENGELWAQATLLRGLLGYYEAINDQQLFYHIEKAVKNIMKGYPINKSHPFSVEDAFSGVAHGLMIVDVLWRMYQLTNDKKYVEYATWLYEEYSYSQQAEQDLQITNARNSQIRLKGHGVHTYEHIRALIIASTVKEEYKSVVKTILEKLEEYIMPSGGCVGDEWILEHEANADNTGYEFCSLQELLHTYDLLFDVTGDVKWADKMEWLFYNGVQGMLHPNYNAIMYLKTDNCYTADEYQQPQEQKKNPRYKYSSTHQDAAVCCIPNAGRITPYFIQGMYKKQEQGILISQYGPSEYIGEINGETIHIIQNTNYPFAEDITLQIKITNPIELSILLRVPCWAKGVQVDGKVYKKNHIKKEIIELKKIWCKDTTIQIQFLTSIKIQRDRQDRQYISRGPLLYVLEIPGKEVQTKVMPGCDCGEWTYAYDGEVKEYNPLYGSISDVKIDRNENASTWKDMKLLATVTNKKESKQIELAPIAHTILRQTTFEFTK